jgi:hypothetical protein
MTNHARRYSTRRMAIVNALVDKLKAIDGNGGFHTNLFNNVHPRLKFWDEVTEFPALHLNAGNETREYQGGGYRDRFLTVTVRCYVNEEDAVEALEKLLEDVETVIEDNSRLEYIDNQQPTGNTQYTHQISIINIDTDEGVLEPLGVGEILLEVRY